MLHSCNPMELVVLVKTTLKRVEKCNVIYQNIIVNPFNNLIVKPTGLIAIHL